MENSFVSDSQLFSHLMFYSGPLGRINCHIPEEVCLILAQHGGGGFDKTQSLREQEASVCDWTVVHNSPHGEGGHQGVPCSHGEWI